MKLCFLGFLMCVAIWSFWLHIRGSPRVAYVQQPIFGLKPARRRPRCELCPRCGALKSDTKRPCYRCGYGFVDFSQYIAHAQDN